MKKIMILMVSILAMVGCSKNSEFENEQTRNRVEMTISAAQNEISRVAFNGGITDMIWEANDQVGVYIAGTGELANFAVCELSDDSQTARFRAEIYEPEALDDYYAFYPATTGRNQTNVYFILPEETTGATTPYLVASHLNTDRYHVELNFRPVTALLELNLGFAADKVVVESINGESLAGVLTYNCADGTITQPAGASSVALTSPAAGTHYLHLPEVTLAKGYKVTVTKGGAQMIKTVSYGKEKKFVAGEVTPLSIASFEGVAVNLGRNYTSYTLFKEGNAQANSVDAGTIYFEGDCSFAGISSTLVKECGVNINGSNITATASNKKFSIANQTGKGQGTYKVYAYIKTVDGTVYKSAEQTHYITGLPYSISFGNTTSPSGWSVGNTMIGKTLTHSFNIFSFGEGNAYAISPSFYIPQNISVTATFKMYAYVTSNKIIGGARFTPAVYIGASTTDVASNKVATLSSQINTYGTATVNWSYPAATVTMTPSVNKVCVHTSGSCSSTYYPCIPTESCTINYAF
jgi:hypothetical protein